MDKEEIKNLKKVLRLENEESLKSEKYIYYNYDDLISEIKNKLEIKGFDVLFLFIGILGLYFIYSSLVLQVGGIFFIGFLLTLSIYFPIKKIIFKIKYEKTLFEYLNKMSDEYVKSINNIYDQIKESILVPFNKRYEHRELLKMIGKIGDLVYLLNNKFSFDIDIEEIFYFFRIYEEEVNFKIFNNETSLNKIVEIGVLNEQNFLTKFSQPSFNQINEFIENYIDYTDISFDLLSKRLVQIIYLTEENEFKVVNIIIDYLKSFNDNFYYYDDIEPLFIKKVRKINSEVLYKKLSSEEKIYDIEYIDTLDGFEFEKFMFNFYKKLGFKVKETKKGGDQGADLILEKDNFHTVVQLKNYSEKVSNKAIQEVVASKKFYDCDKAIVLTNYYFTKSAIELAKINNVKLVDREKLIEMLDSI